MPLTRSRNTSGAPLAVGKDGVALRRSSRTSSLPTPSTPSTSSSRGGQAPSSAKQHSKSLYKAVEPKAQPLSLSRERESSSPEERAPTVASRARSSLSRSEGAKAVPTAAFATVGAPTSSPFVKRVPLFVQRHVHAQPALLLGTSLPASRLVLVTTPSLSPTPSSAVSTSDLTPRRDAPALALSSRPRTKRARSSSGSSVGTPSPCRDEGRRSGGTGAAARRRLETDDGRHVAPAQVEQAQAVEQDVDDRPVALSPAGISEAALMVRRSSIALFLIPGGK